MEMIHRIRNLEPQSFTYREKHADKKKPSTHLAVIS